MSYRFGNREQIGLFPQSVEDYVKPDDPVRAYDAIVESLSFPELGIVLDTDKVGNPQYDPKAMLKLLVYGYSYGIRSSRKLERAIHHNVSFIWLMGGLKPDHKTIAEFRRKNKKALKRVLKQCARLCIELDLVAGNTLFVDGSKIRANASIKKTWDKKRCEKHLKKIDKRIEAILSECDAVDEREEGEPSLVEMGEELKDKEKLKSKVEGILKKLEERGEKPINATDSECRQVKSVQGSHAGYNVQAVVDEKHGFIVSSDVVSDSNDLNQFASQIDQAHEVLGKKCKNACADAGYADTDELEKIDKQEIRVIVPSQRQVLKGEAKPFNKAKFRYDREKDCYICPQGHRLIYSHFDKQKRHRVYMVSDKSLCLSCCYFGICTKGKKGRRIRRLHNEEVKEKLEAQYEQPESQEIYRLRKQRVEHPFGHIKRNLKVNAFLLRGLDGVKAEMSLLASCFDIARMITILGVEGLVKRLAM